MSTGRQADIAEPNESPTVQANSAGLAYKEKYMCGHAPAKVPAPRPESQFCPLCVKATAGYAILASAAERLIAHLGLTRRMKAEIQDLYSRPSTAPVISLAGNSRASIRASRPVRAEPEREAA
jgi:hypothetical protein